MKRVLFLIPVLLASLLMLGCSNAHPGAVSSQASGKLYEPGHNLKETPGPVSSVGHIGEDSQVKPGEQNTKEVITVVLYFADSSGYLAPEKREIPKVTGIARETMVELCRGPGAEKGLMPTIPAGTRVKSIKIKDGLATVDFSGELKKLHWGGSSGELLTVYSIVNTLTQFSSIKTVQILVDGKTIDTLAGHLDISLPLERDSGMIKGSK